MLIDKDPELMKFELKSYRQAIQCLEQKCIEIHNDTSTLICMDYGFYPERKFKYLNSKDGTSRIGTVYQIYGNCIMLIQFEDRPGLIKCWINLADTDGCALVVPHDTAQVHIPILNEYVYFQDIEDPGSWIAYPEDPYQKNLKLYKQLEHCKRTKYLGYEDMSKLNIALSKCSTTDLLMEHIQ